MPPFPEPVVPPFPEVCVGAVVPPLPEPVVRPFPGVCVEKVEPPFVWLASVVVSSANVVCSVAVVAVVVELGVEVLVVLLLTL